jgi:L-ascorbate metabolism protein UlaG (beta-lactamase superfamily)
MKKAALLFITMLSMMPFIGCKSAPETMLLYQGHASFRLTAKNGTVIYIDPYAGEGYDVPADIILVSHQHRDHNRLDLITQNTGCVVITNIEALNGGDHNTFNINGIGITAVEAGNANHDPNVCVGYIITVDGIKLYHAGDTSKTEQMSTFPGEGLDYALLPCDGIYNMGTEEASECATIIGAKNSIPMHTNPSSLFDRAIAERFNAPNRLIVEAGETIKLTR